jgi:tetratricopeptide (TPR) repeat protein
MRSFFTQSDRCCKALLAFFLGAPGYLYADDWRAAIEHALSLQSEGRLAEARRILLNALPQAGQHQDGTRRLACTFEHLASIAHDELQFLDAERYYRRSIALWREGGSASVAGLAPALNNLSSLLNDLGRSKEAYELLRKSEAIQLERHDPGIAVTLMNRGALYFSMAEISRGGGNVPPCLANPPTR